MSLIYEDVASLVNDILSKAPQPGAGPEQNYKSLVIWSFIKAWKTFRSIHHLIQNALAEDAEILARSLFELTVNVLYLSRDRLKRTESFLDYARSLQMKWREEIHESPDREWAEVILRQVDQNTGPLDDQSLKDPKERRRMHKVQNEWYSKRMHQKVKEVGLKERHYHLYKLFSELVHSGPLAVGRYFRPTGEGLEIVLDSSQEDCSKAWTFTCICFLFVLDKTNEVFTLELGARISELHGRLSL